MPSLHQGYGEEGFTPFAKNMPTSEFCQQHPKIKPVYLPLLSGLPLSPTPAHFAQLSVGYDLQVLPCPLPLCPLPGSALPPAARCQPSLQVWLSPPS